MGAWPAGGTGLPSRVGVGRQRACHGRGPSKSQVGTWGFPEEGSWVLCMTVDETLLKIYFYFLAMLCSMQDLSSLTKDGTCAPCTESSES